MDHDSDGEHRNLTRRAMLKRGSAGLGALLVPGAVAELAGGVSTAIAASGGESPALTKILDRIKSKEVIVASYGGDTELARKKVFWDPFTKRTGVTVIEADAGAIGDEMLFGQIPTKWDCFHGSTDESLAARESYHQKLPVVPKIAYEDLIPKPYQPYMFQSFYVGYVPAMIKGTYSGAQPKTWADFFDTKKFPGKRSWPAEPYTSGTREAAELGLGVKPSKVYPFNLPRADAEIKSIFSDFVFYTEFPEAQSFLTSQTVTMSFGPNGLWKELQDKGVDVEVLWSMTPILEANGMNIMPKPPHLDAVRALAAFCNQPKLQAEFANLTNYGPPTKAAFKHLTKKQISALPNAPGRTVVYENSAYMAKELPILNADQKKLFS